MSTKRSKKGIRKPKAVILDIEGTTTDSSFVSKTLFPLIRKNFEKFLDETYEDIDTKDMIRKLRQLQSSGTIRGMPTIVVGSKQQVIDSVSRNVKWQMKEHNMTTEIKQLELLCWLWAYQNNLIKAHIYDDVSPSLHNWKTKAGINIYTFSSGLVLAQKLLFVNTIHGNIHPLIDNFFDSGVGSKKEVESYKLISNKIKKTFDSMVT